MFLRVRKPVSSEAEGELSLSAGDYILVWNDGEPQGGYFDAELLDGRRGLVPATFVQRLLGAYPMLYNLHKMPKKSPHKSNNYTRPDWTHIQLYEYVFPKLKSRTSTCVGLIPELMYMMDGYNRHKPTPFFLLLKKPLGGFKCLEKKKHILVLAIGS